MQRYRIGQFIVVDDSETEGVCRLHQLQSASQILFEGMSSLRSGHWIFQEKSKLKEQ